ncbi:hypothetical protein GC722_13090 [Auraticoccus sp. F435]|uniref:Uncharacterized protein n=1 Tax=Auraticoccus cholistanensis TaxID=2656650 RepID=A0A6A9UW59_9ACTN|nr:hypothetical protein [Auraticoccus cholistanensis]MVA76951.1 hypothetical protein [Auraticoccus cholistanensis]
MSAARTALVPLADYHGVAAAELREDLATLRGVTLPLVDLAVGGFLTGCWVWTVDGVPSAVVVRLGVELPDLAVVREELATTLRSSGEQADTEGVLATGRTGSGAPFGAAAVRLTAGAPATGVVAVLLHREGTTRLGAVLTLFAPGADPRPQLDPVLAAVDSLPAEELPRSARIGLARGAALMGRVSRAMWPARHDDAAQQAVMRRVWEDVVAQLPPDREHRTLGLLRLPAGPGGSWEQDPGVTVVTLDELELEPSPAAPAAEIEPLRRRAAELDEALQRRGRPPATRRPGSPRWVPVVAVAAAVLAALLLLLLLI